MTVEQQEAIESRDADVSAPIPSGIKGDSENEAQANQGAVTSDSGAKVRSKDLQLKSAIDLLLGNSVPSPPIAK